MWEDSYDDSFSSPAQLSSKQKTNSIDFDASPMVGKSKKYPDKKSQGFDTDLLFSSASESNSPAGDRRKDKKPKEFNLDENVLGTQKPTGNYLANFVNNSQELEDSILGELLGGFSGGGGKKSESKLPPASSYTADNNINTIRESYNSSKLDPVDSSYDKSPSPTLSRPNTGTTTTSPNTRPARVGRRDRLQPSSNQSQSPTLKPSLATSGITGLEFTADRVSHGARGHFNSFDEDLSELVPQSFSAAGGNPLPSATSSASVKPPSLATAPSHTSSFGARRGVPLKADNTLSPPSVSALPSMTKSDSVDGHDDLEASSTAATVKSNFVPSFLEPGRQGRRRRLVAYF
jgi:hypothetical protein